MARIREFPLQEMVTRCPVHLRQRWVVVAFWMTTMLGLVTLFGCSNPPRPVRLADTFKGEPQSIVDWAKAGDPYDADRLIDAVAAFAWMSRFDGVNSSHSPSGDELALRRRQLASVCLSLVALFLDYEDRENGTQLWLGYAHLGPTWGPDFLAMTQEGFFASPSDYRSLRDEISDPRIMAWWWNAGVHRDLIDPTEQRLRPDPWPPSIPDPFGETTRRSADVDDVRHD